MLCVFVTSCTTPKKNTLVGSRRARIMAKGRKIYDDSAIVKMFRDAENCYGCGDRKGALKICDDIIKKHKNSSIITEALFLRGEIYLDRHQYDNACDSFNEIILKHNNSPLFEAAVGKQFEIAKALQRGERPHYFGLIPGFKDRNSSVKHYDKVVKNAPFTDQAQEALFNIYKVHRRAKKYDLAFAALDRLIDEYPTSSLLPDAYLAMADMYQSLGKGPDYDQKAVCLALDYYNDFIVLFPKHEMFGFAKEQIDKLLVEVMKTNMNMGDFYYNAKHNPKAAYVMYKAAASVNCSDELKANVMAKMNDLVEGVPPVKTPVDFLFKKYEKQDISAWVKDGCVDTSDTDRPNTDDLKIDSLAKNSAMDQKDDDKNFPPAKNETIATDQLKNRNGSK
ncbi:MAG: tetratricopeptide repeat protein [Puniceicoccales bacterium]|nr:tetratricopeptide repeat protein [Puniceicoccales bacterium]